MAAANSANRTAAFSLRLAIILMLAGAGAGLLTVFGRLSTCNRLVLEQVAVFTVALFIGLLFYRPMTIVSGVNRVGPALTGREVSSVSSRLLGLLIVFIYFVGYTGTLVYALHQAVARGMTTFNVAAVLAATKFAAGLVLLMFTWLAIGDPSRFGFWPLAALLAGATVGIYFSTGNTSLFASIFLWEVVGCFLAARMQAAVVENSPIIAARWLNAVALTAGATCPAINGLVVGAGADAWFVGFAMLAAFLPAIWYHWPGRRLP